MEDASLDEAARPPPEFLCPPVKPSFRTQAGALMLKNLRYQQRNCCTNCCLVLTPLVFSIVLGVISFLLNNLVFSAAQFKCGCQCLAYSYAGVTYQLNSSFTKVVTDPVTGEEFTVWDPNRYPYYDASCTGGFNESACGPYYSELKNLAFCPTTNPERWPVLVQTPVPLYRPTASVLNAASSGGVQNAPLVDSVGTGEAYRDGDGTNGTFPVLRPAPFLYTGDDQAIASELAGGMLFNVSAAEQLDELITSLPAFLANTTIDFTRFNELFTASPFQGGGAFLLGSAAQQQQGSLQTDSAWGSRPILMYLTSDCSLLTPDESAVLTAIGTGSDGLLTTPCVSVPAFGVANAGLMNGLLFSGYGRGAVGSVGSRTNISSYPFAVDFGSSDPASATLKASLLYNGTVIGGTGQPLNVFYRSSGALNRLANSFLAALDGGGGSPRAAMRYMRDMPSQGFGLYIDIGEFLGPLFYTWLAQLLFPVMVGLLVYEKEKNLRTMMRVQGLGDAAYMLVNYIYYFLLYLAYLLLMYVYGLMLGYGTNSLSLWTRSQPEPVILFFILFINVQIGIAFFFQAVFSNAKTATIFSIVFLLVTGLLGNFLFQPFLEADSFPRGGIVGMELIIPFALYRGFYEMSAFGGVAATYPRGQGEQSVGISWAKIAWSADVPGGMSRVMLIFFIESLFIHALAFWLDQVYSSGSGVKRHPLFFLDGLLKQQVQVRLDAAARAADLPAEASSDDGPDVCACRDNAYSTVPTNTAILARGLAKTYPSLDGAPPKVACRELSVAIPAGECFGLLGPNGAGKSTAINLLIGFLTPTRGTAYVQGFNVREELDLVYSQLGVCPQHDLLWEQLSARDHLIFYGRLKNLRGAALREACDEALRSVNLLAGGVGERPCGTYSGGMKRRLSVAISLIGDPPVVFLDEPSTGLDPASRATLWEVIKEAKQRRAIVLTTHAMEEAEELCDRLGIFVDGSLRCVGNPKELTSRYGGFLILTLTINPARADDCLAFVRSLSPGSALTYALGSTLKFDLPLSDVGVSDVFSAVTEHRERLGLLDWAVNSMTLEETFIKLARSIGADSAD